MRYKAILFDMDGVLVDSEYLMRSAAIQALADYGIRAQHEDFLAFTGMGEGKFIGGVVEKLGYTYEETMKDLAYDYYGQRVNAEVRIPQGITNMLQTLHSKGLALAICSAADLRKVRYNIQALNVDESLFSALVSGSDVARKKPAPDIFLEGARRLGVDPKDCLVVEDAISGIEAAHAAGMDAAGIPTTFSREELIEEAHPEYIFNQTIDLVSLF